MPGWLQAWVKVNPVTILADAIRGLLVGGPVATPMLQSLLWAVGDHRGVRAAGGAGLPPPHVTRGAARLTALTEAGQRQHALQRAGLAGL